jgi:hypothetical protein
MASLSRDGNGWRIRFVCPSTKKRRTIRLGAVAKKNADTALNNIERLIESKRLGTALDGRTAGWLTDIDDTLLDRLVKVKRAGLQPWPKPFHGMRASCETDLFERFPLQAVARWIGHSPKIALANYLRVRQEHFDQATGNGGSIQLAQNPARSTQVFAAQGSSPNEASLENPEIHEACVAVTNSKAERTGFEPADQLPGHGFSKPALSTTQPPLRSNA